jgi:hypothetical protein
MLSTSGFIPGFRRATIPNLSRFKYSLFQKRYEPRKGSPEGRGEAFFESVGIFHLHGENLGFARHLEVKFPTQGNHFGDAKEMG